MLRCADLVKVVWQVQQTFADERHVAVPERRKARLRVYAVVRVSRDREGVELRKSERDREGVELWKSERDREGVELGKSERDREGVELPEE